MKIYTVELDMYKGELTKSITESSKSFHIESTYRINDGKIIAQSTLSMKNALEIVGGIAVIYRNTTKAFINHYESFLNNEQGEFDVSTIS